MRIIKILGGLFGLGAVGGGGFVGYYTASWPPSFPDTALPEISASDDPEVVARGDYLVNSVAHCGACHSPVEEFTSLGAGEKPSLKGGHTWHRARSRPSTRRTSRPTSPPGSGAGRMPRSRARSGTASAKTASRCCS